MKLNIDEKELKEFIYNDSFSYWTQDIKYPWYEQLWDKIKEIFNFRSHLQKIRFFFQRRIRGWDDSDTWDMDDTFYKWVYPRLIRFKELTNGYPDEYLTYEDWISEINNRIEQVRRIDEIDAFEFPYHHYLTKETIDGIHKRFEGKIPDQITYNISAKADCEKDFLEWWKNNLDKLWW